jgi:hypothetical protein
MDQFSQSQYSDPFYSLSPSPLPLVPEMLAGIPPLLVPIILALLPLATYPTKEALFKAI